MTTLSTTQIFNDHLMNVMGMLDDILGKYNIGDGEYLKMSNELMALSKLIGGLKGTTHYVYIAREARQRAEGRVSKKKPSLIEKMNNPDYICCKKCNSFIKKVYMTTHIKSAKCSTINQIKKTTLRIKTMGNPRFQSQVLVLNRFFEAIHIRPSTIIHKNWIGQDNIQTKFIQKKLEEFCLVRASDEDINITFDMLIDFI